MLGSDNHLIRGDNLCDGGDFTDLRPAGRMGECHHNLQNGTTAPGKTVVGLDKVDNGARRLHFTKLSCFSLPRPLLVLEKYFPFH